MKPIDRILCALRIHDWKAITEPKERTFTGVDVYGNPVKAQRTLVVLQCQQCGRVKDSKG